MTSATRRRMVAVARWLLSFSTLGVGVLGGCGGDDVSNMVDAASPDSPAAPALTVELGRKPVGSAMDPDVIRVTVELRRGADPVIGAAVAIAAPTATVSAVTELGAGRYQAEVTPSVASGAVPITASALGLSVERVALVLPTVDAGWGQPELVPGLVNTAGYEDSAEVSPDGEWLIVGDYSPIDVVCCQFGCDNGFTRQNDPADPACNTSLGPIGPPERPDLPGAERIVSSTQIHDELPRLGFDLPDGQDLPISLPPIGSYGFRRQPDGSFGEPFVIAFDAGGVTPPYGWTFGPRIDATHVKMVFAYTDARRLYDGMPSTDDDLWTDTITLGQRNVLGTFTLGPSGPQVDRYPRLVPLSEMAGRQSNPSIANDGVFYDQDGGAVLDLRFVAGDPFGAATLAAPVTVALSRSDRAELMPYVHAGRLYFSADNHAIVSSARSPGGNPALPATWSTERVEVGAEAGTTRVGAVTVVGEPSIEVRDGVESLYFIFAITRPVGVDLGLARVRRAM